MNLYDTTETRGRLQIERSLVGRLTGAATRFLIWMPLGMAGLSALFLPDYLGQYREQEPVAGLFWAVLAGLAAFIALIGAAVEALRSDGWTIDSDAGLLVFESRPLMGAATEATVELERLEAVVVERGTVGRVSAVGFVLDGRPDELVGRTRWGPGGLDKLVDTVEDFVGRHDLDVDIERKDASP